MDKNDQKYSKAIELYRTTKHSIREISKETNIKFSVLMHYISTCHSDVAMTRYYSPGVGGLEYKVRNGQNLDIYYKFREAVAACDSTAFIEYNISQIASIFGVGFHL